MDIITFLHTIPKAKRPEFAKRVGFSLGQLHNVGYGYRPCSPELAIALERESRRKVTVEEVCPHVDWAVVRSHPPLRRASRA